MPRKKTTIPKENTEVVLIEKVTTEEKKTINPKVARIWDDYTASIPLETIEKYPEIYGPITQMATQNPVRNTDEPFLFFTNADVFRPAAIAFEKSKEEVKGTGLEPRYTSALEGTKAYRDFWIEEKRRCLQGYEPIVDDKPCGVRITGEHYFYLNYCMIGKAVKNEMTGEDTEELGFPNFASMDYYWFKELEKAENPKPGIQKQNMIVAKARRKGFSYKNAAGAVWKYSFFKNARVIIAAEYGTKAKQTFDMCLNMIDFLNQNTEFRSPWTHKKTGENKCYIRSGVEIERNGRKYTKGKKSIIETISFHNKPDAAAGASATRILIEEAGLITNLKKAWKFTEPLLRSGSIRKGIAIAYGCVTAGTKLWNEEGKTINVENIKEGDLILGYDKIGPSIEPVSFIAPSVKKQCFEIITDKGTRLEASFDHPILASNNHSYYQYRAKNKEKKRITSNRVKKTSFVQMQTLQRKDQVAVIDSIPIWGEQKLLEARFVGWLIGDGSYGFNKTPVISTENEEIFNHIKNNYPYAIEKERHTKDGNIYREIRIKQITQYLRSIGIYGQTKQAKRLPKNIHYYDKQSLAKLLGGLFDTDGCVSFKYNKKGHINGYVNFTTAVKELAEEVKTQLLKFGIHAGIEVINAKPRIRKIKDKSTYYRVSIRESVSVKRFYRNISFAVKYKQNKLIQFYRLLKQRGKESNITRTAMVFRNGKEFAAVVYLNGIRFETIKSKKNIGLKTIYNLTADNTHTYLANNIITHNTGGDMDGSTLDFSEMFTDPLSHSFKSYDNIYEEHETRGKCGWFVDDMWFREGAWVDINGIRYEAVDENGNARKWVAEIDLNQERSKLAGKDKEAYNVALSQYCKTVSEAFLITTGNVFPVAELSARLSVLKTPEGARLSGVNGELVEKNGVVFFQPDLENKLQPINRYPTPKSRRNLDGCVVQFEAPQEIDGKVPSGAYIISIDPLGIDSSGGESLVAIKCLKTKKYAHLIGHDEFVMSYVGRPSVDPLDTTNWILLKMAKYYNAKVTHENDRNGAAIRNFFIQQKEYGRLLSPPSDIVEKHLTNSSTLLRKSGHSMGNEKLKEMGEIYLKRWLLEKRGVNPITGIEERNLDKLCDRGDLEELISYNRSGNFDRCLVKGTKIVTKDGLKPIENITVNDLVLTHTGQFQRVLKTTEFDGKVISHIDIVGLPNPLQCTADHPILVAEQAKRAGNRHWKFNKETKYKAADQLIPYRDFVLIPKISEPSNLPLSEDEQYLLGWYIGDGYVNKNSIKIIFGINELKAAEKIKSIIDKLSIDHDKDLHYNTKTVSTIVKKKGCYILTKTSPYVASMLKKYGGIANNKKFQINSWFAAIGIIEAEGHLKNSKKKAIEVGMMSEQIIQNLRQVLINNGVWSTYRIDNRGLHKLTICGKYINRVIKDSVVYEEVKVGQSRNIVIETDNGFYVPVKKVLIFHKPQKVYNCEVDNDHTYISGGIATHNCMAMMGAVLQQEQMLFTLTDTNSEEKDSAAQFFIERLVFLPSVGNRQKYKELIR